MSRRTEHPCQVCNAAPAHSLGEGVVLCTRCMGLLRKGNVAGLARAAASPAVRHPLSSADAENLARLLVESYALPRARVVAAEGGDDSVYTPVRSGLGWLVDDGFVRVVSWTDGEAVHLTVNSASAILPLQDGWTIEQALIVLARLERRALEGLPE